MKVKVNVRDLLAENSDHGDLLLYHGGVEIDDLLETNGIDQEREFDVHELLAEQRAIALIWDADMLVSTYPHLREDQAWEVLQECERNYTGEAGLTWDDVAEVVNDRFPDAPEAKQRLLDRLHSLRRLVEALPADVRTNPAAYGEIAAKVDAVEEAVEKGA